MTATQAMVNGTRISNPIIGDFENQSVENGAIFILKFEPKAPPKTATVTFEIDGGTWNSTAPESIVLDVENGPAKLSDKLLPLLKVLQTKTTALKANGIKKLMMTSFLLSTF